MKEVLEIAFKKRRWSLLLSFFERPENQKKYSQMFEVVFNEVLKEARENKEKEDLWFLLLDFYKNPENQKKYPEILKETLERIFQMSPEDLRDSWTKRDTIVNFFKNPESQRLYFDTFKIFLEKLTRWHFLYLNMSFSSNFVDLFLDPQNRVCPAEMIEIRDKLLQSRRLISDQNLRIFFDSEVFKYLLEDNPLSLLAFSSSKDLPLLIVGKNLGIDPLVIQTWDLSKEEKEILLSTFFSLLNKGIKVEFPFPYYPRPELKFTKKHNEMLIEYFKNLDFLSSLPKNIFGDMVSAHFKKIKEIIQKYNVRQTALQEISFSFLKEILSEVRRVQKEIYFKLKELIPFQ